MNLVFFTHPDFVGHKSMPRFARMLSDGMSSRGHSVEMWTPKPFLSRLSSVRLIKKWLGYFDQYVVFPRYVKKILKAQKADTLFIFTDQALGPWIPLVADRLHVIHCHDFIALRSSLGEIPEFPTSWTGNQYQKLIQRGFIEGRNFISNSQKTREDLHRFLTKPAQISEVVYNGFHQSFLPTDPIVARETLGKNVKLSIGMGYILHVGGNAWYKNRLGVLEIYEAWRSITASPVPLLALGEPPSTVLLNKQRSSPYASDIHWLTEVDDELVRHAYSGASVLLFPSLDEGFGWPIAEAMAAGCPVVTTGERPMSEVAADAAILIPRKPGDIDAAENWARDAARTLNEVMTMTSDQRLAVIKKGIENASRFDTVKALDKTEAIYARIASTQGKGIDGTKTY
jgi:glycosyltransferase involved in cell wall biosynthesis